MTSNLRRAVPDDLPVAERLLRDNNLPVADLEPGHLLFIAEVNGVPSGVIGLERHGDCGLLRSLVVSGPARSIGLGRRLVNALESFALEQGIVELWLLTIDAGKFFSALGYAERARDAAPAAIRGTAEFSTLCPGSAVLMSKAVGRVSDGPNEA